MSVDQFNQMAAYNKWANARLYAAALDLSAHSLRIWRDRLEQSGLAIAASSECPGSTK